MRKIKEKLTFRKLNWNTKVKVKLTDYGKDLYFHQFDHLIKQGASISPVYPEEDENGFTSFRLWVFINLYGPYIHMAGKPVVEDLNFYIPENKLEAVDV